MATGGMGALVVGWRQGGLWRAAPAPEGQAAQPCQVSATLGRQQPGDAGCNVRLGSSLPWAGRGTGSRQAEAAPTASLR